MRVRTAPRTLRWAAWALVAGVLVAGCSDPDQPGTVPRTTPTPLTSTPSPTPTSVEAQLEATMRAYFSAANEMFKTGQVAKVREFSGADCPCRKTPNSVEDVVSEGGRYEGTTYNVTAVNVHDVAGATAGVEVKANVTPYKVIAASGKIIEDSPGGQLHTDYSLVQQGTKWLIVNAVNLG
jgi:hypothetical protein